MILFVDKDTTLFRSSSIRYRGWLYYLANSKTTASLLASSYERDNKNAVYAAEALARWRDACWSATGNSVSQP